MRPLVYRSKLFVHGCDPDDFPKAFATDADSVVLNNEDHVEPAQKEQARRDIAAFVARRANLRGKVVQVRVNEVRSAFFHPDIVAMVRPGVDVINLPKVESPEEIRHAADAIAALETAHGVDRPIGLLINIESPAGFRRAAELACAADRVVGLQIGYGDLLRPLGIDHRGPGADTVRLHVRFAAAEGGVSAFDGAYLGDPGDLDGYRRDAARALAFGFTGKSCNTSEQVDIANATFPATGRGV